MVEEELMLHPQRSRPAVVEMRRSCPVDVGRGGPSSSDVAVPAAAEGRSTVSSSSTAYSIMSSCCPTAASAAADASDAQRTTFWGLTLSPGRDTREGGGLRSSQQQRRRRPFFLRQRRRHYLAALFVVAAAGIVGINVTMTGTPAPPPRWWWWDDEITTEGGAASSSTTLLLPPPPPSSSKSVALLYIVSMDTKHHEMRIQEMRDAFVEFQHATKKRKPSVRLVVVWDNGKNPDCPARYRQLNLCLQRRNVTTTPSTDLVVDAGTTAPDPNKKNRNNIKFSHRGKGQETALWWSIDHQYSYDYVWFMEQDVHYTNVSLLLDVLTRPTNADLLHHGPMWSEKSKTKWVHAPKAKKLAGQSFGDTPLHWGMLNLFGMSPALVRGLDEIYWRNSQRWIFFEALVPTTAAHFNLTFEDWTAVTDDRTGSKSDEKPYSVSAATYQFRYRPCFVNFPVPGIYHPAKAVGVGTFRSCGNGRGNA